MHLDRRVGQQFLHISPFVLLRARELCEVRENIHPFTPLELDIALLLGLLRCEPHCQPELVAWDWRRLLGLFVRALSLLVRYINQLWQPSVGTISYKG